MTRPSVALRARLVAGQGGADRVAGSGAGPGLGLRLPLPRGDADCEVRRGALPPAVTVHAVTCGVTGSSHRSSRRVRIHLGKAGQHPARVVQIDARSDLD